MSTDVSAMIVYLARNEANGKEYVGITTKSLECRRREHANLVGRPRRRFALHNAILAHGLGAFTWRVIATASDYDELLRLEIQTIKDRNTLSPHGYNLTGGGEGLINPSDETRARMSASQSRRKHPPEVIAKISAAISARKQRLTPERMAKMLAARMSKPRTPEQTERSRLAATGKRHSEASRKLMSLHRLGNTNGKAGWEKKRRPCLIFGVRYESVSAAARGLGFVDKTIEYRLNQGFPGYLYER